MLGKLLRYLRDLFAPDTRARRQLVLWLLQERPMKRSELAERSNQRLRWRSLEEILSRMERDGLVTWVPDEECGCFWSITDAGRAWLKASEERA